MAQTVTYEHRKPSKPFSEPTKKKRRAAKDQ